MKDIFAQHNNSRISDITRLAKAGDGKVSLKYVPEPRSNWEFFIYVDAPINQFTGGKIRLVQQALFDEFGFYSEIYKVEDYGSMAKFTFAPDQDTITGIDIKVDERLQAIANSSEVIKLIGYKRKNAPKSAKTFSHAPRCTPA